MLHYQIVYSSNHFFLCIHTFCAACQVLLHSTTSFPHLFLLQSSEMFRSLRPITRLAQRAVATPRYFSAAAPHAAPTVAGILSSASKAQPLKDAVKFYDSDGGDPSIWSYQELASNVSALSSGLQALGYGPGSTIVSWLSSSSPEYATLVLASANVGATLVAVPPPTDPLKADVSVAASALRDGARMFVFDASFRAIEKKTAPESPVDLFAPLYSTDEAKGVVAKRHSILDELAPGVSENDATGTRGFAEMSGLPFHSAEMPDLEHVVHTGSTHVRGALSFRSILAYNGKYTPVAPANAPLVRSATNGDTLPGASAIKLAEKMGAELGLGSDHTEKTGKIVVKPDNPAEVAKAMIAAVMYESLYISPNVAGEGIAQVAEREGALLMQ